MAPKARSSASTSADNDSNSAMEDSTSKKSGNDISFYYLTADARQKLPHYQYRGADLSLLYHYILSPLAAWCVNYLVPLTVAPNSITLFGLVWMFSAYLIHWYYAPSMEIEQEDASSTYPPRWIFLWNGISMLAYQTLDNMDGKQARRTKSSSPLGLLFDHGCDAINSIFGSANWIISMALVPRENLLQCWALVFGPFAMFYIATWEQYRTGELIMPIINGPNEGLLGGVLLSFISCWYGPYFWQGTEWSELLQSILPIPAELVIRNCDFVIMAASIGFVQEITVKTYVLTRKHVDSIIDLVPFLAFTVSFFLIGYREPTMLLSLPRTNLHLAMLLFVEMSTEIMLAHVTAQTFSPWGRWHILPLILLTVWITVVNVGDKSGENQEGLINYWIIAYTWSLASYLLFKFVLVIREICTTLHIWCFDIVTPYNLPSRSNGQTSTQKDD